MKKTKTFDWPVESGFGTMSTHQEQDPSLSNAQAATEAQDESTGSSIVTIISRNGSVASDAVISENDDVIDSLSQTIERTSISSTANESNPDDSSYVIGQRVHRRPSSTAIKCSDYFIGNESGTDHVRYKLKKYLSKIYKSKANIRLFFVLN